MDLLFIYLFPGWQWRSFGCWKRKKRLWTNRYVCMIKIAASKAVKLDYLFYFIATRRIHSRSAVLIYNVINIYTSIVQSTVMILWQNLYQIVSHCIMFHHNRLRAANLMNHSFLFYTRTTETRLRYIVLIITNTFYDVTRPSSKSYCFLYSVVWRMKWSKMRWSW